jgi:hypothetical protein
MKQQEYRLCDFFLQCVGEIESVIRHSATIGTLGYNYKCFLFINFILQPIAHITYLENASVPPNLC